MKEAILFPYDISNIHLLMHQDMLSDFRISGVVSPNSWGYADEDAGRILGIDTGYMVRSSFEGLIDQCECVLFCESYLELPYESYLKEYIEYIAQKGKKLIFLGEYEQHCEEIKDIAKRHNAEYEFIIKKDDKKYEEMYCYKMKDIPVPIITVIGTNERTNKFDTQLSVGKFFKEQGYKVLHIGTKGYSNIFDMIPYPKFMYNQELSTTNRIQQFNWYIYSLCIEQKPDVVILGVPGAAFPMDNKFHNNFGFHNYLVSNAILSDYTICSIPYEDYKEDYFNYLSTHIKYKYGYNINCFIIANQAIKWDETDNSEKIQYLTIDIETINRKCTHYLDKNYPVFNIFDCKLNTMLTHSILDELYSNSEEELM
ncbi:TIGR04066 family peptide maturation system protein [Vallitalea guaymasensis]|uniref:TIGR04066 family peptide maturation system protein n=1 Tax=Vallitalea guaymasensis TaxID=1185412 RepID=UPI00272ABEFC|nr:TIGR04066 family peptide maturation system protein [Vallitalea guaymasensis]